LQLDEFKVDLGSLDLGDLQTVDIGFATKQTVAGKLGSISGMSWNLTSVEVRVPLTSTAHFALMWLIHWHLL